MSTSWERLQELFEAALGLDDEARAALLAGLPPSERVRLERLLAADAAPGVLDGPAVGGLALRAPSLPSGTRAGAWEIVGELGRGGMGRVYAARRADGLYEQRVALKTVDAPWAAGDLADRFAAERAILASLEHPGIARLLDAGHLADGTPFLVLEHVDGLAIDRYCEERGLGLSQRLELVERVCEVVGFAHRRLVVHCDLKPPNVLVTPSGEVKLLDFGIARLLGRGGRAEPSLPRRLTPAFASPEQRRGDPLTTASDVYGLGALLAALVTGTPRGRRADLAAVLARALAAEPAARYNSAEALAEDLRRWRGGYPVLARPLAWPARTVRFLARHRLASAVAFLALSLATAGVFRIEHERRRAEEERARAERAADFLASLFRAANPADDEAAGRFSGSESARAARETLLDEGAERVRADLAGDPAVQSRLLLEIGNAYRHLGAGAKAVPLLEAALALRRAAPGSLVEPLLALCRAELAAGRVAEAEARCREAQALLPAGPSAAAGDLANELGLVARARGDLVAAGRALEEGLALRRAALPAGHPDLEASLNNLALVQQERGDPAAAEPLLREVVARRRTRLGTDHLLVLHALNNLASVAQDLDRADEAAALYDEALVGAARSLGESHPFLATLHNNRGTLALAQGDLNRARTELAQALALGTTLRGPRHPEVAGSHHNLGVALHAAGEAAGAARHLAQALAIRREALGAGHPDAAASLFALVTVELERGEASAAEEALRAALTSWAAQPAAQPWAAPYAEALLGRCRQEQGDLAGARRWLMRASAGLFEVGRGPETGLGRAVAGWLAALPQPPGTPKLTERTETPLPP